jgi:hypothetical protein
MEYASTDNAQKQLSVLLEQYASYIIVGIDPSITIQKFAISESQDTCELIRDGYIYIPSSAGVEGNKPKDALGYGGNGTVYPLIGGNKYLRLNSISFNDNRRGGWGISNAFAVIKVAENDFGLSFLPSFGKLPNEAKGGTFISNDLYHESIVLALLSILYDGLVTLHIPKIFSTVVCPFSSFRGKGPLPENKQSKIHLILERASYDIHTFLTSDKLKEINVNHLILWTIQLIFTVYIMKKFYHLVNFDMHVGNILLVDLLADEGKSMVYGNKLVKNIESFSYAYFGQTFILPSTRWLLKISDFGLSTTELPKEDIKFRNSDYVFHHSDIVLSSDKTTYNTLEINYFIRNLLCILHLEASYYKSKEARTLLDEYYPFALAIYPGAKNYYQSLYNVYPSFTTKGGKEERIVLNNQITSPLAESTSVQGKNLIYLEERNWGEPGSTKETHIQRLLQTNIWSFVNGAYTYNLSNAWVKTGITLKLQEILYQPEIPRFFNQNLKYARECVISSSNSDSGSDSGSRGNPLFPSGSRGNPLSPLEQREQREQRCEDLKEKIEVYPILSTFSQSLGHRLLRQPLRNGTKEEDLTDFLYPLADKGPPSLGYPVNQGKGINYYFMQINPSLTPMPFLTYQPYHRGLDYKPPSNDLINKPLPSVRMHLMYLTSSLKPQVKAGFSLYEATKEYNNAIAVNGGFFIVGNNVDNYLTPSALESKIYTPIGFYKDPDIITTQVKIPYPYENDFGVVAITHTGNIELHSYPQFLTLPGNRENLQQVPTIYQEVNINPLGTVVERNKYFAIKSNTLKDTPNYGYVFCSGPVLVSNGQVVFNVSKLNELMRIEQSDLAKVYPTNDVPNIVASFNRKLEEKLEETPDLREEMGEMTESKMLGQEQVAVGTYYTASSYQQNIFKYYSNIGESKFPFGQRASNNFNIHNAICRTRDGKLLFILTEGRGYESMGIDRMQFTQLVSKFNVDFALALDTGFSANILVKLGGEVKFCALDPQRRQLGASMVFTF